MQLHPDVLGLDIELATGDFADVVRVALRHAAAAGWELEHWAIPSHARPRKKGLDGELTALAGSPAGSLHGAFTFVDGAGLNVTTAKGSGAPLVVLRTVVTDKEPADRVRVVERYMTLLREMAVEGASNFATMQTVGPGAECLPHLPIAGMRAQLALVTPARVEDDYVRADEFCAAWDRVEMIGETRLVSRAVSMTEGPELLAAIQDGQWRLARAALPGRVRLYRPTAFPPEEPIFRRGEGHLQFVGYDPSRLSIELACVLADGEHARGWEIYDLWGVITAGGFPDGREVREARVVFLERESADAEKRPLLDIGARVFCQGGEADVEIVDA